MNDPKSLQAASRDGGDIGGKGASPKKHSGGAKVNFEINTWNLK